MTKFPEVPKALLEQLEYLYPDRCPQVSSSEREVWLATGAVQVVRLLRHHYEKQNESILQGN